jgi:hypothetical protein
MCITELLSLIARRFCGGASGTTIFKITNQKNSTSCTANSLTLTSDKIKRY